VAEGGKEPNFVLPAHLASALRKDKELGTNLAAAASLPFSGVSYASMMSLYTPPQPAAKKTIQKKKADAQLDSAWQKELRKRQKEEAKKEAEKRKKEEKEKEKERRRMEKIAEKEAKRGTEKDRRENDNGTPADDEVTRLIAARVKARIEKKQEEIGTDTDAGLAGGTTLIGECAAKRFHFFEQIPGSADCCMECLPDIADGFGSVECLVPLARYVYTQCKGGHCAAVHARCFPKFARQLAFKNKDGGKQKYANYPTMADMNKIPYNEGSGDIGPGWFPPDATGCPMCLLDCFKGARSEPPERLIRAEMWSRGTKTDILGLEPPDPVPTRQESTELGCWIRNPIRRRLRRRPRRRKKRRRRRKSPNRSSPPRNSRRSPRRTRKPRARRRNERRRSRLGRRRRLRSGGGRRLRRWRRRSAAPRRKRRMKPEPPPSAPPPPPAPSPRSSRNSRTRRTTRTTKPR
jgi:pyruvate/2-oxoglutarate dehydrogenase complex dihydrolipoamide acyltransferase (E2) component